MGVGERRGRRGGHRRAHHRHNHHHHNRHRRRHHHHHHHGGRRFHGARPVLRFGWRPRSGGVSGAGGSAVPVTTGHYALLIMLIIGGAFGFVVGMALANIGGWLSSAIGIVGMFILITSFVFMIILVVIRCHMVKLPPGPPAGEVEAGNPNMTVSTVTLEGTTTASQVGETTSYISPVSALQPGGVTMGTQPGYPGGPAQPYAPPTHSYPVAPYPQGEVPYPLVNNSASSPPMPYPQPGAPQPGAPPLAVNYSGLNYPAQPHPTPDGNDIAPPPSYSDVMTGNVK